MSIDERIAEIASEQLTAHGFNPTTHTVVLGLVADAIRAALADPTLRGEIENAAYERAAKVCEELNAFDEDDPGETCAAAIRALKK